MGKLNFDLKLPKGYLSYSAMNEYLYDPQAYYRHYFLGIDFMEDLRKENPDRWEKIRLGSIFQDAWADPRKNWRKVLQADGFTSNKERIIKTALACPELLRLSPSKCEQTMRVDFNGIPLLIKVDAWDLDPRHLIENKFGAPRSQETVDEDNQLSFYDLGLNLLGIRPKRITLQSVNDKSGKVVPIETTRSKADRDHIGELIMMAAKGISEGIWEK